MSQHPQSRSQPGQQTLNQRRRAAESRRRKSEGRDLRPVVTPLRSQPQQTARSGQRRPGTVRVLPTPPAKRSRSQRLGWIGGCFRLSFLGLSLATVVGTAIAILHPSPRPGTLADSLQTSAKATAENGAGNGAGEGKALSSPISSQLATIPILAPDKEFKTVKSKILSLAAGQTDLVTGVFVYNPESEAYLDIAGDKAFSAASTIKFPVLVAFFQEVDAKRISPEELLTMRKDLVASESGNIQYQPVGTKFSALETADLMITISDNTATNMLIDRLGGMAALNQRFKGWGLTQTAIHNPLPDLQGTNTISPKDLSMLMLRVAQGEFLSPHSRDRALEMMRNTVTNTLLSPGLGEGAKIAHKTGDIGSVVGDVGLIEMPTGQRYVATAMVQRPHNDPRAQELIRQISRIVYQDISQPAASAVASAIPAAATAEAALVQQPTP